MTKLRTVHRCGECGAESAKWAGRCPGCGGWETLVEEIVERDRGRAAADARRRLAPMARAVPIAEVDTGSWAARPLAWASSTGSWAAVWELPCSDQRGLAQPGGVKVRPVHDRVNVLSSRMTAWPYSRWPVRRWSPKWPGWTSSSTVL
jgi:hypothetical protein